ncbi:MAG TPA: hypothetical protein VJW73_13260 [Gemmatimonadaceae bacterium]|nr:hypothetical protein [Gemmatimonadaceae bacterium]
MYTHCFVCRRSLGENDEIPHLTIGRKVAFDVERGRLWVVCPHCGQWCLTPLEDRWETIADCEALFGAAEARVSTTNVGLARAREVELIRIGPALRDEIANWRYGPRLTRRRRAVRIAGGAAAVGAAAATAGTIYLIGSLAVASASTFVGGWLAMLGLVYAYKLRGVVDFTPVARVALPGGAHRTLLRSHLPSIYLHRRSKSVTCVIVMFGDLQATYSEDDALHLLNRLLPHANWRGASPPEIEEATKRVDKAEHVCRKQHDNRLAAWEHLAVDQPDKAPALLMKMSPTRRLALEMAVNEELEHRAMSGTVTQLADRWSVEEEIARTSDDMFLPQWIGDWIRAAKRRVRPSP